MTRPQVIAMDGQVWGVAAPGPAGPVFVTSYAGDDLDTTVLAAVDLAGKVLWRREFDGHPGKPRVSEAGTAWIAHRGPGGHLLSEVDAGGSILRSITPDHEPHEHLGAFVLLPDGFCVAWTPAEWMRVVPPGLVPRVARYDQNGRRRWSTTTALGKLSFAGLVRMGADTGWEPEPEKPWTARTIEVSRRQPLLISGDRIAATYADGSSGLAVTFFLDAETGQLISTTEPGPSGHKVIFGLGEFLLGYQGYGAFSTARHDRSGAVVERWRSHVMPLIDRDGGVRGPESENILHNRSQFRGLRQDGSLRDGPTLSGYYTTYPALDSAGTAVFWRDGRLLAVDAGFELRRLFAMPDERAVMSRILLLEQGQLMLALNSDLLVFRDTGLAPLDSGVWPCGDGNLQGNPRLGSWTR